MIVRKLVNVWLWGVITSLLTETFSVFQDIVGRFGSRNKNCVLFSKTEMDAENMFGSLLAELVSKNAS